MSLRVSYAAIISCDRYSGYKGFANETEGFELAFCWVHQRRDFLNLANSYPEHLDWAFGWVQSIGHARQCADGIHGAHYTQ